MISRNLAPPNLKFKNKYSKVRPEDPYVFLGIQKRHVLFSSASEYIHIIFKVVAIMLLAVGASIRAVGYPNQFVFFLGSILLFSLVSVPIIPMLRDLLKGKVRGCPLLHLMAVFIILLSGPFWRMIPLQMSIPILVLLVIYFKSKGYTRSQVAPKGVLRQNNNAFFLLAILISVANGPVQVQIPDKFYEPMIVNPAYNTQNGPTVYVDEYHHNMHTLSGLYWAFGKTLRKDGYHTRPFREPFTNQTLHKVDILVIANALNEKNVEPWINGAFMDYKNWKLPNYPAFTESEIEAVKRWVEEGGSLFLIADHMPFPAASMGLAKAFGFNFRNGYAKNPEKAQDTFSRNNGTLKDNQITNGFNPNEKVEFVLTTTGQAFQLPDDAESILTFDKGYLQWDTEVPKQIEGITPYSIEGYSQGAFKSFGKGRVVVFGEASMFTSQITYGRSWKGYGLSSEKVDNLQLLLNTIHWLDPQFPEFNKIEY